MFLGIETSCDETSIALVDDKKIIHAMTTINQAEHKNFGGVVPEIAARAHLKKIIPAIQDVMKKSKADKTTITAISATLGPGLLGGLLVGASIAKSLTWAWNKPFIAINHLSAHALSVRLSHDVAFPYLLLLISGGHCQLLAVRGVNDYRLYGETLDDSAGEAFDKGARLLGLLGDLPSGGPAIEKSAKDGVAENFSLPIPMQRNKDNNNCDFSFSGIKTALKNKITNSDKTPHLVANASASLQHSITQSLVINSQKAIKLFQQDFPNLKKYHLAVVGGVAANQYILENLTDMANEHDFSVLAPPPKLCTDNGAMIAWAGIEFCQAGLDISHHRQMKTQPRWPIHPHIYQTV